MSKNQNHVVILFDIQIKNLFERYYMLQSSDSIIHLNIRLNVCCITVIIYFSKLTKKLYFLN
jgi:hypothetical protein